MDDEITIAPLLRPGSVEDPPTEIARDRARRLLAGALRAEADAFAARAMPSRPCQMAVNGWSGAATGRGAASSPALAHQMPSRGGHTIKGRASLRNGGPIATLCLLSPRSGGRGPAPATALVRHRP